jgi:hypothetical protein
MKFIEPYTEQIINDIHRTQQKRHILGVLNIRDVLYAQGAIEINDMILDAVVNVTVIQHGTNDLEIESFEVKDNIVYLLSDNDEEQLISINFNAAKDTVTGELMTEFENEIVKLALQIAKDTSENDWNYRLIE